MLVSILGYFVALFRMEMVSEALEPLKALKNREARGRRGGGAGEARGGAGFVNPISDFSLRHAEATRFMNERSF